MAMLIANEWEVQDEVLKQYALPMVSDPANHSKGLEF